MKTLKNLSKKRNYRLFKTSNKTFFSSKSYLHTQTSFIAFFRTIATFNTSCARAILFHKFNLNVFLSLKFLFSLLLLNVLNECSAQTSVPPQLNKTKFGIYLQIDHYQPNDGFLGENYISNASEPKKMYSLGFSMRSKVSRSFTISTGVGLTNQQVRPFFNGIDIEDTTYPGYKTNCLGWHCSNMMLTNLYSSINKWSINLPFLVQYYPFKNKFFISSGAQVNIDLYNQHNAAFVSYDGTITQINSSGWTEGFNIMMPLGIGLNLPLVQKKVLSIEPGIKLLLTNVNSFENYIGLYTLKASFYF